MHSFSSDPAMECTCSPSTIRFCRLLAGRGAKVTGADLTRPLTERVRALGREGQTYLVGDAVDLAGVDDAGFDLAIANVTNVIPNAVRNLGV